MINVNYKINNNNNKNYGILYFSKITYNSINNVFNE